MVKKLKKYPEQDEAGLKAMADFYAKQHGQVYFVRCLNCKRVIAVEVPMPSGNIPQRGRHIYGYQDLFITTRTRLDKTPSGAPMVGYECACGNDTRLGAVENGEVPTSTAVADNNGHIVQAAPPVRSLSPFEREQLRVTIALKQAGSKAPADYETDGTIERFESFQIERVA